jgi:RNA polymerase sigma-70 factor (ECF subfamily)
LGDRNRNPAPDLDLAALFREHAAGLAGAVRGILGPRADTAELLQEAFLKAWQALAAGTRPANPPAWVFVLTMNLARDRRRARERRGSGVELSEVDDMNLTTRERGPAAKAEDREVLAATREAIGGLAEEQKEVFLLRVSGELSFEAIGEALGIPVGTAKTRMRTALRRLRHHLQDFAPEARGTIRVERGEAR